MEVIFFERYFGGISRKDYSFAIILDKPRYEGERIYLKDFTVFLSGGSVITNFDRLRFEHYNRTVIIKFFNIL